MGYVGVTKRSNHPAQYKHPLSHATGSPPLNTDELDHAFGDGPHQLRVAKHGSRERIELSEYEPRKRTARDPGNRALHAALVASGVAFGLGVAFFVTITKQPTPSTNGPVTPVTTLSIRPGAPAVAAPDRLEASVGPGSAADSSSTPRGASSSAPPRPNVAAHVASPKVGHGGSVRREDRASVEHDVDVASASAPSSRRPGSAEKMDLVDHDTNLLDPPP